MAHGALITRAKWSMEGSCSVQMNVQWREEIVRVVSTCNIATDSVVSVAQKRYDSNTANSVMWSVVSAGQAQYSVSQSSVTSLSYMFPCKHLHGILDQTVRVDQYKGWSILDHIIQHRVAQVDTKAITVQISLSVGSPISLYKLIEVQCEDGDFETIKSRKHLRWPLSSSLCHTWHVACVCLVCHTILYSDDDDIEALHLEPLTG